ncbi:hypothetical protein CEP51_003753 [Fusarium floridanum]|uniref:NAD-dependent epimerase/dehydratase domain-containing protein n=2 Tax=Fusarium solani species complex TaxID=232080 RepID=A0A428S488_9HYPO|nr:hypothetical protein CEP51_003753 [Fusarium floridanum]
MPYLSTTHIQSLDLALPLGSLIVVSGVNGFIGSHIADQLLAIGYRVRGTVRSLERSGWLEEYFGQKYETASFELIEVVEIDKEGAFDDAVAGAKGVVHTASINNLDRNPDNVVPKIIAATLGIAKSAAKSPSVKRLVLTSSIAAVADPKPGVAEELTKDTYNEEAVEITYSGNIPPGLFGGHTVYAAGKTKAEQAFWQWYKEEKPDLVVNTVLPSPCFGRVLSVEKQGFGSANAVLKLLFDGDTSNNVLDMLLAQWYVDVVDVSILHLGGLLLPEVKSERLFANAGTYTVNDFLRIFRTLHPDLNISDDIPNVKPDLRKVPNERPAEVLKLLGVPGWTSLEDCVGPLAEQFAAASE